jgi:hypothetical protein
MYERDLHISETVGSTRSVVKKQDDGNYTITAMVCVKSTNDVAWWKAAFINPYVYRDVLKTYKRDNDNWRDVKTGKLANTGLIEEFDAILWKIKNNNA